MAVDVIKELRQACHCLRLEVPPSVADDVKAKAEAVIAELERSQFYIACLEDGGVDNWEWFHESLAPYREKYPCDED